MRLLEAIQRRAKVTASISIVKLEVETFWFNKGEECTLFEP